MSQASSASYLCHIVVDQGEHPPKLIGTVRFDGETPQDVKRRLDTALQRFPFSARPFSVAFDLSPRPRFSTEAIVEEVRNVPGADMVSVIVKVIWKMPYFLPRDPTTRDFVDLRLQMKCLEILMDKQD